MIILMKRRPPRTTHCPYPTPFLSSLLAVIQRDCPFSCDTGHPKKIPPPRGGGGPVRGRRGVLPGKRHWSWRSEEITAGLRSHRGVVWSLVHHDQQQSPSVIIPGHP